MLNFMIKCQKTSESPFGIKSGRGWELEQECRLLCLWCRHNSSEDCPVPAQHIRDLEVWRGGRRWKRIIFQKAKEQIKVWRRAESQQPWITRFWGQPSYQEKTEGPSVPCSCINPINFFHGNDAVVLTLHPAGLAEVNTEPCVLDYHHWSDTLGNNQFCKSQSCKGKTLPNGCICEKENAGYRN